MAARKATGEYLVFLNPRTIVPPGWLERLVRHCRRDPSIGAVAAVTKFSEGDYENVLKMQAFALDMAKDKFEQASNEPAAALDCVLVPEPHGIKWLGSRVSGLSPPTTPSFIDLEIFRRPNSFGSAR